MDRLTTIKAAVSAAAAALTAFWGWAGWLAAAWFLAMLLDYATGSAAALHAGTWSSRCAREGLWHKAGSVAGVLVAALLLFISGIILSSQLAKDARDFEFQLQTVHQWENKNNHNSKSSLPPAPPAGGLLFGTDWAIIFLYVHTAHTAI